MKRSGYLDMYFDKEAHKYGLVLVYDDGSRSDFVETGQNWKCSTRKENGFLQNSLRMTLNTV